MSARISRRTLLAGLAALPALPALTLVGCEADRTTGAPLSTVDTLDFGNRLRMPALAESTVDHDGVRVFHLSATEGSAEFLSGQSTPTWSYSDGRYDAGFLGPTLRATRGEKVRVIVENRLPEITTVHWHGMHLPARYDGGPHQPIADGELWQPEWEIDQQAATLWYHPHPHGETEGQVTRGLAGLFYLDDGTNADLPHRYMIDDIPIILQDRTFDSRGRFSQRGRAVTGLLGDKILVNGTYNPTSRSAPAGSGFASSTPRPRASTIWPSLMIGISRSLQPILGFCPRQRGYAGCCSPLPNAPRSS